jgi:predicted hydrocarbon binding protein
MFSFRKPSQSFPPEDNDFYYPNRMGRIVLTAMEDVMGHNGVNSILNFAKLPHLVDKYPPNNLELGFSFSEFGAIQESLDELFGFRGGRALAQRTGRESFHYALKEFMPVLGIADLAFRPLHLGMKLKIGLEVFAETFNKFTDQQVRLSEDSEQHFWIIERCPVCWNRITMDPCCHVAVGLLEQSLQWVSNGRQFLVKEEECIAAGDYSCIITISKKPVS